MEQFDNIQWVIQENLTNQDELESLVNACDELNIHVSLLKIIPFSNTLPSFNKEKESIFYGSTTFGELVYSDSKISKGLFFDKNAFSISNYILKWGKHMLNSEATVTTLEKIVLENYDPETLLFVRPDDDSKSFSGEVLKFADLQKWHNELIASESIKFSTKSKIIASKPYHIKFEWRLWIVNKKVIASSKYREDFQLKKERGCPENVVQFAEDRCLEYTPHDVFIMDICQTGDTLYILECGCMNSAGFYASNVSEIVRKVSLYYSNALRL